MSKLVIAFCFPAPRLAIFPELPKDEALQSKQAQASNPFGLFTCALRCRPLFIF